MPTVTYTVFDGEILSEDRAGTRPRRLSAMLRCISSGLSGLYGARRTWEEAIESLQSARNDYLPLARLKSMPLPESCSMDPIDVNVTSSSLEF